MNDIKDSRFFGAGHAIFTVDNGKGNHYTFKISHRKETQPLFIKVLTGKNNEHDYTYLGVYNPYTKSVILTEHSRYTPNATPVKVIKWAINLIHENKPLPQGYSIKHEGYCCRCGRLLTTSESIENGIGPECIKKQH